VHLIDVGDCADEEQFLVDPGVVAHDSGGQGTAEGTSLVPQRRVLGDGQGSGKQFVAAVIGDSLIDEAS
jgi:hypothetical protein